MDYKSFSFKKMFYKIEGYLEKEKNWVQIQLKIVML